MEDLGTALEWKILNLGGVSITLGKLLETVAVIVVILLLGTWLIHWLGRRLSGRGRDANLVQLISRLLWAVLLTSLFFTALGLLGVPLGAFAFISGAVALGVGFGAQNIINNFISGWILMGERPIRIGDLLEIQGTLGRVEAINTRSTRIMRVDGVRIVVPNSHLLENVVVNWNLGDQQIRTMVAVGVAYGSPVRQVAELIEQAVTEQDEVLLEPEPRVLFQDFGNSALLFEAYFWTELRPGGDLRKLRSDIRFRIDELFREQDITIAFPQQDVHLDGRLELVSREPESS